MLWHKSWLETRWRFLIGLALMLLSACGTVLTWPKIATLLPLTPLNVEGEIGRRIQEAIALSRTFRGFVWSQAFGQNLTHLITLFAILLGIGGFLSRSGGALFTLSLPISRQRLVATRAAAGLAELLTLALLSSLVFPLLAPAVGARYGVGAALIHALCLFVAGSVFFSMALLLSTAFADPWRPLLFALLIAFALGIADVILKTPAWSVYGVMSGQTFFRSSHVPWGGLLVAAAISTALTYGAAASLAQRDF